MRNPRLPPKSITCPPSNTHPSNSLRGPPPFQFPLSSFDFSYALEFIRRAESPPQARRNKAAGKYHGEFAIPNFPARAKPAPRTSEAPNTRPEFVEGICPELVKGMSLRNTRYQSLLTPHHSLFTDKLPRSICHGFCSAIRLFGESFSRNPGRRDARKSRSPLPAIQPQLSSFRSSSQPASAAFFWSA